MAYLVMLCYVACLKKPTLNYLVVAEPPLCRSCLMYVLLLHLLLITVYVYIRLICVSLVVQLQKSFSCGALCFSVCLFHQLYLFLLFVYQNRNYTTYSYYYVFSIIKPFYFISFIYSYFIVVFLFVVCSPAACSAAPASLLYFDIIEIQ